MPSLFSITVALTALSLLSSGFGQDSSLASVKEAFHAANIPEDTSLIFNPTTILEVQFPQLSGPPVFVSAGAILTVNQTATQPVFAIQQHPKQMRSKSQHEKFVVTMLDLDAPTPQNRSSADIVHTIGGNFTLKPSDQYGCIPLSNSTPALVEYLQPAPSAGSDPHRYVFFLFKQPYDQAEQALDNFQFNRSVIESTPVIANFNISLFVSETELGYPIGGTYMLVGPNSPD